MISKTSYLLYMHTCIHTYIHTYTHTHIHTYIHMYICTYIHTYIRTYVYIMACVHHDMCRSSSMYARCSVSTYVQYVGYPGEPLQTEPSLTGHVSNSCSPYLLHIQNLSNLESSLNQTFCLVPRVFSLERLRCT